MVNCKLEAFRAKDKTAVPAKDISFTVNPQEMQYTIRLGRWRKRIPQRERFPLMSTNFRFPDHQIRLTMRIDEEDMNTWKDRSKGYDNSSPADNKTDEGLVFKFDYNRPRPGFADISTKLGYFIIDSVEATLAEDSASIGGAKGKLEWNTTILLTRVALTDDPLDTGET